MNITKPFDINLFNEHDKIAKDVVIDYYKKENILFQENPDKYDVDLIHVEDGNILMGIEVEHRMNWKGTNFPYSTINVPARKYKYSNRNYKTFYCALNMPFTAMFVMDLNKLNECNIIENKNKYVHTGELFYSVPLYYGKIVYLNECKL
jgi:hypothetical protein